MRLQMYTEQPQTPHKIGTTFDWLTIPAIVEFTNNQVSENQLRWWLRSKKSNGLGEHTRTIGRKIYINKIGFMEWFDQGAA